MLNDQAATSELIEAGALPQDGLTLAQLENLLSDIRFQPKWRDEASKAADYYDGHQLTQERLQRMERLGIPPLVTNLIRPTIDAVLGLEAKTRTDWRVIQEDEATPVPEIMLNALNQKLTEAERESRADRAISDAHASQIKSGIGWVEVSRATDAMAYPYRVSMVHRDEIWWDWRAKQPDLTDARYLVRKRRFDVDELTAMMPEHAEMIRLAVTDKFRSWQWDARDTYNPSLAYAIEVERLTNLDENEWRDAERQRATLFEVWYRVMKRGWLLRLPNGKVVPYKQNDPRHVAAVMRGLIQPFQGVYGEIRVAFYMGPHRLYDFPSPYPHRFFPYVPFWGYKEDKSAIPYGLIRGMISPQDVVNSSDAKMHWMLNARRLIAHSNAIDTRHNSWKHVQDELSRPDSVVLLDPNQPNSEFRVEQDFQLNAQQFQRRVQAANDIENAGGVYKAMLGKEGAASSGIAINALVEQGSVTLAEINDNYRFARRQVGEMLFALVREDIIGQPTPVAVNARGSRQKQVVTLNNPKPDGTLDNNVAMVNAKVVLTDVPSTPAFRAQQLQVLSEVVKSLPPQMQMATVDVLVKLTDVPDKDLLVDRLRRMAGIQDIPPEQEDAAAAAASAQQQKAEMLQTEAAIAAIDETRAKTEKLRAEAQATLAEIDQMDAAGNSADPRMADLQEQLRGAIAAAENVVTKNAEDAFRQQQEADKRIQDLQDKIRALQLDRSLDVYKADQQYEIGMADVASKHEARMKAAENKPTPAKKGDK